MKCCVWILLLLLPAVSSCSSGARLASSGAKINSDDYQVYSAILKQVFSHFPPECTVIRQSTVGPADQLYGDGALQMLLGNWKVDLEAVSDLRSKEQDAAKLQPERLAGYQVDNLESVAEKKLPCDSGRPRRAIDPWPAQLVSFGRVGYNTNHTAALLFTAGSCGGLCGRGLWVYLVKGDSGWRVQQSETEWVS